MNAFARLFLVGLALVCQACATQRLWAETDPKARIWIDAGKTTEDSLRSRGVAYQVYEAPQGRGYLIEKSGWQKMGDYQLRLFGTPVTLALDTATTVAVIGVYMFLSDPYATVSLIEALCH